jgi:glyoxylase-like metal-dependent hydrolase (beta-lactamase superfamily II)
MKIQTLVLGPLETNCYLAIDEISGECLIIDPADDAELISDEILRQQLKPIAIIATHGHYDHIMAASALQLNFDLPFMLHPEDEFLVKDLVKRASFWQQQEIQLQPPKITNYLKSGQEIKFGKVFMKVVHTPGHTPGGVCIVNYKEKTIFTGDTLFSNAIGRTDLSYSLPKKMKKSVKNLKESFQGFEGFPGHGKSFII